MSRTTIACCVLAMAGCAAEGPATGAEHDPAVGAVVDRIAGQYLAQSDIVGLSVTVARDGRVVHEAAYGLARRSPELAADANVPFDLLSLAKPVTAVLLLKLAELGKLDLDATAGSYLEGLSGPYAAATLRQLLRHSAGTQGAAIDETNPAAHFLAPPPQGALLAWLSQARAMARPDETWSYDESGFLVAGLAAEARTGKHYGDDVQTMLVNPLELRGFGYCSDLARSRAQSYRAVGGSIAEAPRIDYGWFGGAGSLCATSGDLARWWLAARSGRLVGPSSLQQLLTPVTLERNGVQTQFGYGLGLRIGNYRGHAVIGETGEGAGGTSVLAEYPDDRLLVVVATNTAGPGVPHAVEVQAAIARELLKMAAPTPTLRPLEPEALATVPGLYHSPEGSFCVEADEDSLSVSTDEKQAVVLEHLGDGRFMRPGDDDSTEFFPGWPDQAEWFGYAWFGLPMDLATRDADTCE